MTEAWTAESLLAFEEDIAQQFGAGKIKAPVHLAGGNERQLIETFWHIKPDDWVLCGWRSHYHCLLKGVPAEILREAILDGRSVGLCFPSYRIICSGIVGGVAPIAVGLAWAEKRKADENPMGHSAKVWCFLGDMTAESGIVHEAQKYAAGHGLPVKWVVEDNGKSVCTDTRQSWGPLPGHLVDFQDYKYELSRPHAGIGQWVKF